MKNLSRRLFGVEAPVNDESIPRRLELYSLCGPFVLKKLHDLAKDVVARGISGDVVECGVFNGGSAAAVACAVRDTQKRIWLYDSFEGLPESGALDGSFAKTQTGTCLGSEAKVREAMQLARFPLEKCIIRKGWFDRTFQDTLPESISLLHIDCDWYDSVALTLNTFYGRVSEGGIIILDDFGHWEGCREAFYDFAQQRCIKPLLERFGHTEAFWIKGRLHNRDFNGKIEIP